MFALRLVASLLLPAIALAAKSAGCGNTTLPAGLTAGGTSKTYTITSGGQERSYLLYLPSTYTPTTASPLILSYHGNGGSATNQESITQFSQKSFNPNFIAVYGNGAQNSAGSRSWQGASYSVAGVNDVQYTADVLDFLESTLCVDTDRIYATGKSNGGGFVALLSCDNTMTQRISAFMSASGAYYPATHSPCNPGKAQVPFLEFHGDADTVIPYQGGNGAGGVLPTIPDWLQEKAKLNGCQSTPDNTTVLLDGLVTEYQWNCGQSKPVLVHYNETKLGHSWPGTEQTGSNLVYATPKVIEFFNLWS